MNTYKTDASMHLNYTRKKERILEKKCDRWFEKFLNLLKKNKATLSHYNCRLVLEKKSTERYLKVRLQQQSFAALSNSS